MAADSVFLFSLPVSQHGPPWVEIELPQEVYCLIIFSKVGWLGVGKSRCVTIEEGSLRQKDKVLVWSQVNG